MDKKEIGEMMCHWRENDNDPVYEAGYYFYNERDCPRLELVVQAHARLSAEIKKPYWGFEEVEELNLLVDELGRYIDRKIG